MYIVARNVNICIIKKVYRINAGKYWIKIYHHQYLFDLDSYCEGSCLLLQVLRHNQYLHIRIPAHHHHYHFDQDWQLNRNYPWNLVYHPYRYQLNLAVVAAELVVWMVVEVRPLIDYGNVRFLRCAYFLEAAIILVKIFQIQMSY
jgi:hypothetical protein